MTFRLGLTGSIGMGKTTTAQMFADEGCAVWDADAAVHRLYETDGQAVMPIRQLAPSAVVNDGVNRAQLREAIAQDADLLAKIEQIVHPLVAEDRRKFTEQSSADIAVYDIPLLFETNGDQAMDAVACVHIDVDEQRRRVLDRGTMTQADLDRILAKQLPIQEKLARSDFKIDTSDMNTARKQVKEIVNDIRRRIDA